MDETLHHNKTTVLCQDGCSPDLVYGTKHRTYAATHAFPLIRGFHKSPSPVGDAMTPSSTTEPLTKMGATPRARTVEDLLRPVLPAPSPISATILPAW